MRRRALLVALALIAQGCATPAAEPVTLALANAGAEPLRCQIIHGHWVTGAIPVIPAGGSTEIVVLRDPGERSLFLPREDDGRRLMIEQLACGLDADWSATLTFASVEAARTDRATRFALACDVTRPGGCRAFVPAP